ncbi:MAG TPA: DUF2889 domain-containing protein [Azospirillum sp.]
MPLSEAAAREHIHTREVVCRGYRRTDGLWDIEGHLTDVKSYAFNTEQRGRLEPGDPVHEMWIRLTVDDRLTVHAIEVVTEKSPYRACGDITPDFQKLVGLNVTKGWTRAVKERLGGVHGCTHLVELLGPVATTAFQTVFPILSREAETRAKAEGKRRTTHGRPPLLDMCHMFSSDGEHARRHWPDHYTGERKAGEAAE